MHDLIREHLEEHLGGDFQPKVPPEFYAHLEACADCRALVKRMQAQAELFRQLRCHAELDPAPGFYARVAARIEAQRAASLWSAFLDPVFGRALVLASAATLLLLGAYLVSSERSYARRDASMMLMASQPPAYELEGSSPERDRHAVLVTLASYEE
ncbi:MAG: hypothetical protein RMK57_03400 [Bryobacterales bacterium]|nr:hypothetical protein [Bryobacteraceae bacterium]MDW8353554.1 hypothetical protein [Bryobacterales bacterium]